MSAIYGCGNAYGYNYNNNYSDSGYVRNDRNYSPSSGGGEGSGLGVAVLLTVLGLALFGGKGKDKKANASQTDPPNNPLNDENTQAVKDLLGEDPNNPTDPLMPSLYDAYVNATEPMDRMEKSLVLLEKVETAVNNHRTMSKRQRRAVRKLTKAIKRDTKATVANMEAKAVGKLIPKIEKNKTKINQGLVTRRRQRAELNAIQNAGVGAGDYQALILADDADLDALHESIESSDLSDGEKSTLNTLIGTKETIRDSKKLIKTTEKEIKKLEKGIKKLKKRQKSAKWTLDNTSSDTAREKAKTDLTEIGTALLADKLKLQVTERILESAEERLKNAQTKLEEAAK